jgi:hypothetical protein
MSADTLFSIRDLFLEWEKDPILQTKITLEELHPTDKMKLSHAVRLVALYPILKQKDNVALKALGFYFQHCKLFYDAFHDNDRSLEERFVHVSQSYLN